MDGWLDLMIWSGIHTFFQRLVYLFVSMYPRILTATNQTEIGCVQFLIELYWELRRHLAFLLLGFCSFR